MKKIDQISQILIVISTILFLAFYLCLSFYNRAASDDVVFISMAKGKSLFSSINEIFNTWSGRWTSWAYLFTVLSSSNRFEYTHFYIFTYYVFTLLVLSYSLTFLIHFLIKKIFSICIEYQTAFVYGIVFIASFFYFTVDHIEAWWWLSASFYYLQGIVFLLFGLTLLIREKKHLFHYILIALSFVFAGASFEIYILIFLCLFIIALFYFIKNKSNENFQLKYNVYAKGVIVAFFAFLFSAIVCFSAPGNYNRRADMLSLETNKSIGIHKNVFIQKKYLVAIGLSSIWMIFGMRFKKKSAVTFSKKELKKIIFVTTIPLLVSIIITYLFQLIILKGIPIPMRGWTFTSFGATLFFSVLFFLIGYTYQIKSRLIESIIKIGSSSITLIVLSIILVKQYNYTNKYAKAYDRLITQLIEAKKDKSIAIIYVKELPASGMLTPLDIKDDYIKNPLKNILELDFKIEIKE